MYCTVPDRNPWRRAPSSPWWWEAFAQARPRGADGAGDVIDEVTSAGDADRSKPAPDLVQVALEKAGLGRAAFPASLMTAAAADAAT
jgi:hypothetical protein